MPIRYLLAALAMVGCACSTISRQSFEWRDGDVIFQSSQSGQSRAIELATKSSYSHVGIVHLVEGQPQVLEAIGPVQSTALPDWIARGNGGRYAVRRLPASHELEAAQLQAMRQVGEGLVGRPYDWQFGWSDEKMYCSELVWKIYERGAGIRISEPRPLSEFDLSHPEVAKKVQERWGDAQSIDERMVSPEDLFASAVLETLVVVK